MGGLNGGWLLYVYVYINAYDCWHLEIHVHSHALLFVGSKFPVCTEPHKWLCALRQPVQFGWRGFVAGAML
jgi:hypothetical protein